MQGYEKIDRLVDSYTDRYEWSYFNKSVIEFAYKFDAEHYVNKYRYRPRIIKRDREKIINQISTLKEEMKLIIKDNELLNFMIATTKKTIIHQDSYGHKDKVRKYLSSNNVKASEDWVCSKSLISKINYKLFHKYDATNLKRELNSDIKYSPNHTKLNSIKNLINNLLLNDIVIDYKQYITTNVFGYEEGLDESTININNNIKEIISYLNNKELLQRYLDNYNRIKSILDSNIFVLYCDKCYKNHTILTTNYYNYFNDAESMKIDKDKIYCPECNCEIINSSENNSKLVSVKFFNDIKEKNKITISILSKELILKSKNGYSYYVKSYNDRITLSFNKNSVMVNNYVTGSKRKLDIFIKNQSLQRNKELFYDCNCKDLMYNIWEEVSKELNFNKDFDIMANSIISNVKTDGYYETVYALFKLIIMLNKYKNLNLSDYRIAYYSNYNSKIIRYAKNCITNNPKYLKNKDITKGIRKILLKDIWKYPTYLLFKDAIKDTNNLIKVINNLSISTYNLSEIYYNICTIYKSNPKKLEELYNKASNNKRLVTQIEKLLYKESFNHNIVSYEYIGIAIKEAIEKSVMLYGSENAFINKLIKNNIVFNNYIADTIVQLNRMDINDIQRIANSFDKQDRKGNFKDYHDYISREFNLLDVNNKDIYYSDKEMSMQTKINNYIIGLPQDVYTLKEIGKQMGICVGSYDNRALSKDCVIAYIKDKDSEYQGCIELRTSYDIANKEVIYTIVQAKGKYNVKLENELLETIKIWANKYNIKINTIDIETDPTQHMNNTIDIIHQNEELVLNAADNDDYYIGW